MNKYFKKLFSVFLVFTIGTLGVVFATQNVLATFDLGEAALYIDGDYFDNINEYQTFTVTETYHDEYTVTSDVGHEFVLNPSNGSSIEVKLEWDFDLYTQVNFLGMEFYNEDNGQNFVYFESENNQLIAEGIIIPLDTSLIVEFVFGLDNTRPAIDGQENAVTNVNNPEDVNFFVKLFRAFDDVDGDISDRIVIDNDGYTANKTKIGKYPVTISATDDAGNKATLTFYINVVDIDTPIITGDSAKVRVSYDKVYDVEAFRKTLDVSDNYDVLANSAITIKSDGYTANKTKLGNYEVVFTAKDSSDNSTTFTKQIEVYDGVKPSFSGITAFTKGYNKIISVQEIIKDVKANDFIDGDITNTIKIKRDGYTGNANKVGVYEVELEVSDKAGNKAQHVIKITVTDDKGANWYIENGYTINLAPDATLTRVQIVELLVRNNQVNASANSRVTYTYDNYSDNIGEAGVYVLGFTITEPNGNESAHEYAINVMSSDDTNDDNQDTLPGDFDIKDHLKNYGVYYLIGIIAVAGLAVVVFRKK